MDVEPLEAVDARRRGGRDEVQILERAQRTEVEDRPQVDEEGVGPLTGEHLAAAREAVRRLVREVRIVRRAADAHVDRRNGEPGGQDVRVLTADLAADRVGLRAVERGVRDAVDRAGVVQERRPVADPRGEPELVAHVRDAVTPVADVDLVEHVVTELEEVRPTHRVLHRDEVSDQGHGVGGFRADEGVDVGVVGDRVLGDLRCFAVRGHQACLLMSRTRAGSWTTTSCSPRMTDTSPRAASWT